MLPFDCIARQNTNTTHCKDLSNITLVNCLCCISLQKFKNTYNSLFENENPQMYKLFNIPLSFTFDQLLELL